MARTTKPRDYISPSDLTFLYGQCPKCFWLKYRKGISTPGFMPLVGPMANFHERTYYNAPSASLDPSLPKGRIARWGDSVESEYLRVGSVQSRWKIKGKYDLIVEYDSGHLGLVDCKVTTSDMDDTKIRHYQPQLEAYCFALEHPLTGTGESVLTSGLMMWKVVGASERADAGYVFDTQSAYLDCSRDPEGFQDFIGEVIELIEGPEPASGTDCGNCKYLQRRLEV